MSDIITTKADGNKAYAAHLIVISDQELLGVGTVLGATVFVTDAEGTELYFNPTSITTTVEQTLYETVKEWAKQALDPSFNMWATRNSGVCGRMNAIPVGDGVKIRFSGTTFIPVAPA